MEDDDLYDLYDDDPCDHDGHDVDVLSGRATCFRCGEAWSLSNDQLRREIEWLAEADALAFSLPHPQENADEHA